MRHAWANKVGMLSLVGVMVLAGDSYAVVNDLYPVGARVLDATYKLVGPVVGTDSAASNPNVVLNISGTSIVLQVTRDSFRHHASLYFTGMNCSGQAYIEIASTPTSEQRGAAGQPAVTPSNRPKMSTETAPPPKARSQQPGVAELLMSMAKPENGPDQLTPLFPYVSVMNNVVYGQRANTSAGSVTVVSSYNSLNPKNGCQPTDRTSTMVLADPIVDLATQFTPPFSFAY